MNTIPTGWVPGRGSSFDRYIGPFYYPTGSSMDECGFITDERHSNTRGVVHGAMISPAFDLALGNASWAAAGECACATVQLNVHFVSGMNLGEFAIIRSEIIRATRSLVFARGVMRVGERTIAAADGVWRILSDRAA